MSIYNDLRDQLTLLEESTVSDSFGGASLGGRAPVFSFNPIMVSFSEEIETNTDRLAEKIKALKELMTPKGFTYLMSCLGRFSFCIELTNLSITSTKMKTRWLAGLITKTRLGTFENYEGEFRPGEDPRSSSFDECLNIFEKCIDLISSEAGHILIMESLKDQVNRGTPYESVFTYSDVSKPQVHTEDNIRLINKDDIQWLISARPIIQPILRFNLDGEKTKLTDKIATKSYKTDRTQTGTVQTNRAKRWECLVEDYQHASIEECWSVERKLLNDLAHFEGFPEDKMKLLQESGLFTEQSTTLCPITFNPMSFDAILGGGAHGQSIFQVGHMLPLKNGGRHKGDNIEWISDDGNRIQGSLNISDTRLMLQGIFERMFERGLID
jgi:hypothetical protein|tara:strand:- start:2265 stop:3413 length:1149 start_codon:yes stop_codon:yes gene_type:complete